MNHRLQQLDRWLTAAEDEHLEFKEAKQRYDFEEQCVAISFTECSALPTRARGS